MREAADRLGVALVGFRPDELRAVSDAVVTVFPAVQVYKGVSSVAEAAASLAAGSGFRLLGLRTGLPSATCALAVGGGSRR